MGSVMQPANKPKKNPSWHVIGAMLGHFRRGAGYTQFALAERLCVHEETIASIEQGRRPLKGDLAGKLDELLETKGALGVGVTEMPQRERYPLFAQDFIEQEQLALTLLSYENQVVPGLLQTEGYARAVFSNLFPPISDEEIGESTSARIDRQKVFERKPWPPMMNYLVEEVVLHRPIEGEAILREQMQHLRRCAELPFLGLQIMPTNRQRHAGLAGPMVLLETPDHDQLAYFEGQHLGILVDDPDQVSTYHQKYGMLRSQALTPEESMGLLDDLLGDA
ncbi:helix-turn-helix transcriptional regulator [Streptomyces sp. SPB162]|uniref:helix-turn-helix domain-containing protein n=1 Tax=Streptomyces sp. SPB162 TaxID=2940560 RepID=UPI002404A0D2|nr:helix-turn-helix transcriptional regulator [Streptomyces sp. SPB162]MDF9815860.1 transcriptional regulator with XRE-family HTH domain [Streptomyces sp. SPB162]